MLARDRYLTAMILWTDARDVTRRQPIYHYLFDRAPPVAAGPSFGAFHSSEIPYVFGVLDSPIRLYGIADRGISDMIQGYWLNFITQGDPNGPGLPRWRAMQARKGDVMVLGRHPGMRHAVSSSARFAVLRAFAAGGGLALFSGETCGLWRR